MKPLASRLAAAALVILGVPSCFVYGESLRGLDNDGSVSDDGDGGSVDGPGAGGASSDGGAGQQVGGTGGALAGGGDASGGGSGSADGGSGGSDDCNPTLLGQKQPISDVTVFEDFNVGWSNIGDGSSFNGAWNVSIDTDYEGTDLYPLGNDWDYESDPCFEDEDKALHVTGSGYGGWGVDYTATLKSPVAGVNLSQYDGVKFYARTGESNIVKFAVSDTADVFESPQIPLEGKWKLHKVPFPASADAEEVEALHLVILAAPEFDLWIDDISFYTE